MGPYRYRATSYVSAHWPWTTSSLNNSRWTNIQPRTYNHCQLLCHYFIADTSLQYISNEAFCWICYRRRRPLQAIGIEIFELMSTSNFLIAQSSLLEFFSRHLMKSSLIGASEILYRRVNNSNRIVISHIPWNASPFMFFKRDPRCLSGKSPLSIDVIVWRILKQPLTYQWKIFIGNWRKRWMLPLAGGQWFLTRTSTYEENYQPNPKKQPIGFGKFTRPSWVHYEQIRRSSQSHVITATVVMGSGSATVIVITSKCKTSYIQHRIIELDQLNSFHWLLLDSSSKLTLTAIKMTDSMEQLRWKKFITYYHLRSNNTI